MKMQRFNVPFYLRKPIREQKGGVWKTVFPPLPDPIPNDANVFFGSFQTYGGTETTINDVFVVLDTAEVKTYYRPDITKDCRIVRLTDNAEFSIVNQPENYLGQGQYMFFKVERIVG